MYLKIQSRAKLRVKKKQTSGTAENLTEIFFFAQCVYPTHPKIPLERTATTRQCHDNQQEHHSHHLPS